jgi:hypothetical protein
VDHVSKVETKIETGDAVLSLDEKQLLRHQA